VKSRSDDICRGQPCPRRLSAMNKVASVLFWLWSAACMGLFFGMLVTGLQYGRADTLTLEVVLMAAALFFSSVSFCLIGRKKLPGYRTGGLFLISFLLNAFYVAMYNSPELSVFELNMVAHVLLFLFWLARMRRIETAVG
jgi:hypothetical protein